VWKETVVSFSKIGNQTEWQKAIAMVLCRRPFPNLTGITIIR